MRHTTHLHELTQIFRSETDVFLIDAAIEVKIDRKYFVYFVEIVDLIACRFSEGGRVESFNLPEGISGRMQYLEISPHVYLYLLVVYLRKVGFEMEAIEDECECLHQHEVDLPVVH